MNKYAVIDNRISLKNISIIFLLLVPFALSVFIYSNGLTGNDFWWHIKVGEWICNNHTLPSEDIFSWYGINNHLSWRSQEWLSDVIFYIIYSKFGERAFFLFCVLFENLFLMIIVCLNYNNIKNRFLFSILFLCFTSVCFTVFIYGRPQIFSGFILFIQLELLYRYYCKGKVKYIIPVPLLTVLWSNLHGGSANLSYTICFIYFIVSLIPFKSYRIVNPRKKRRIKVTLLMVSLISVGAIFVNPQGVYVFVYPYVNMSNSLMLGVIREWNSPDAKDLGQIVLYFFPLVIFFLCMILGKKKILLIDGILILMFMFLFFRSIRFVFYLYIVISVLGYKYFPSIKIRITKIGSVFTIIVSVIFFVFSSVSLLNELNSKQIIKRVLDDQYCELIRTEKVDRIYNDYNYAETLIYNNIQCFVDSRVDLFADNIFEDAINLCFLTNMNTSGDPIDPKTIIETYQFDSIIIQKDRPLRAYLDANPDEYSLIKSDNNTAYYRVNKFYHK